MEIYGTTNVIFSLNLLLLSLLLYLYTYQHIIKVGAFLKLNPSGSFMIWYAKKKDIQTSVQLNLYTLWEKSNWEHPEKYFITFSCLNQTVYV